MWNLCAARRKAFSITELLVVVAIILILAALIFVGANTLYVQAMQVKCQHNLEQIGHGLPDVYVQELWSVPQGVGYGTSATVV